MEAMRAGAQPIESPPPQINQSIQMRPESLQTQPQGGMPAPVSMNAAMSQAPLPPEPEYKPKPIRVRLGSDKGLQGIDKSIEDLKTDERAAKDFPSSKVIDGEILPPKMHHGLGDRLKSIGKGALIAMGEYARTHPGASAAELLSAGAAGGTVGGVSPVSIDALQSQARVGQHRQQVGNEISLEAEQAQLENLRQKPVLEQEKLKAEAQRQQEQSAREQFRMEETARHNRATETRGGTVKPPLIRERKKADGSTVTLKSDDNGQTWQEVPELASEAVTKPENRGVDRDQLISNYDKRIKEYETKAEGLRNQAKSATYQADITRFSAEADAADKAASDLRTKRDVEAAKPKARPGRYTGQRISKSKLPDAARRLGMTAAQARAYLEQEGATIY